MKAVLTCLTILVAAGSLVTAEEKREWNQQKALAMVDRILAVEKSGKKPWDKIRWQTDVDKAVATARRTKKPIFVYWYVDKGGPADAPC